MSTIVTGRLTLRPVTSDEHAVLHAMCVEPGVRRFLFDDEPISRERTTAMVAASAELFRTHGFGLWLARRSDAAANALPVGFGGLWLFRDPPDLELLFAVGDAHLKQGYGREIARAIVAHAFGPLDLPVIRASTDAAHRESRRLLLDLGFTPERRAVVAGLDTVFYVRHRDATVPLPERQ